MRLFRRVVENARTKCRKYTSRRSNQRGVEPRSFNQDHRCQTVLVLPASDAKRAGGSPLANGNTVSRHDNYPSQPVPLGSLETIQGTSICIEYFDPRDPLFPKHISPAIWDVWGLCRRAICTQIYSLLLGAR